jgi:hypothetical protein
MKTILEDMFHVDKYISRYFSVSILVIIISYLVYLFFKEETVNKLGREDGLFEYLSALSFLITSIFFFINFLNQKKIVLVLFALIFFVGMGEEISWGQRIFNFGTPDYFKEKNIQNELNLHNLELFDSKNIDGQYKTGISYFLSINFLYKLFWLIYGIILPVVCSFSGIVKNVANKIGLPVPPVILGSLFLINWTICKIMLSFLLPDGRSDQYYYSVGEIREFGAAFIFMILGAYFYQITTKGKRQLIRIT